ncbi:hypothetical protein TWF788_002256 [Orbilia oligospora]|uniref:Uncharacterized protein n=1 Tax=Orbilia oligospora TaxID=2813651 RepID=A0A7C8Q142_ORBOL|nr:hypothetical protein TWF788_002256 [Orbilia oligospora]
MTFVDILVLVGEALVYVLTKLATSLRSGVAQLRSPTAPLPSLPTTLSATQTSTSTDENATVGGMGGGTPASRPGADESRNNTQSYDNIPCSLPGIETFGPTFYELEASSGNYHNFSSRQVNLGYRSMEAITLEMLLRPRDNKKTLVEFTK